jgi:hypothetical protein
MYIYIQNNVHFTTIFSVTRSKFTFSFHYKYKLYKCGSAEKNLDIALGTLYEYELFFRTFIVHYGLVKCQRYAHVKLIEHDRT